MSAKQTIRDQQTALREASRYLKLDQYRCLVLNRDYMPLSCLPISAVGWQDAIVGVLQHKYEVLENYDERVIRTPSKEFKVPSVVVTKTYSKSKRKILFSKANIFLRDNYECQYCDGEFTGSELTFDHLVPRARGGKTTWLNIVSACDHCNRAKGSKTLKEFKLPSGRKTLKRMPYEPTHYELSDKARTKPLIIPDGSNWENYLQWIGPLYVRNAEGSTYQISGDNPEAFGKEDLGY